jgi:lambda repressor-like predicted transcriptional regulator
MSNLQNKVKAHLALSGLTLKDLADHMGVTYQSLNYNLTKSMGIKKALHLTDSLKALTNHELTLEDFR